MSRPIPLWPFFGGSGRRPESRRIHLRRRGQLLKAVGDFLRVERPVPVLIPGDEELSHTGFHFLLSHFAILVGIEQIEERSGRGVPHSGPARSRSTQATAEAKPSRDKSFARPRQLRIDR